MKQYAFGIDVGGTTIKAGLFNITGSLIEKWEIPTRTENSGEKILDDIADTILNKMQENSIIPEAVLGIGIGIPGPVDEKGIVRGCVNLGWQDVELEYELRNKTGLIVRAGNDANVAALGEMWMGGGQGYRDLVVVTLFYHFWVYPSTFFFTLSNIYFSTTLLRRYPLLIISERMISFQKHPKR